MAHVMISFGFSGEWNAWRGPDGNGTTPEKLLNVSALNDTQSIRWTANVGMGHSAACVDRGKVFITGNKHMGAENYQDFVFCFNARTGQEIWDYSYACPEGEDPGPAATPVVSGNRVYTLSREGHLFCLETTTSNVIWKRNLSGEGLADSGSYSFASSPVIYKDLLLLNVNQNGLALQKQSGEIVWNSPKGKSTTASTVLYQLNGTTIAVFNSSREYYGVVPETGEVKWVYKSSYGGADPVLIGQTLLITGGWTALLDLRHENPVELWRNNEIKWQFQSAAVRGNYAFGFAKVIDWSDNARQEFICLDLGSGQRKWEHIFSIWGSSIIADDMLIILSGQGRLLAAKASPNGFKELSGLQVLKMADHDHSKGYRRDCYCWTNPVLANGLIYCRNSFGELAAVACGAGD